MSCPARPRTRPGAPKSLVIGMELLPANPKWERAFANIRRSRDTCSAFPWLLGVCFRYLPSLQTAPSFPYYLHLCLHGNLFQHYGILLYWHPELRVCWEESGSAKHWADRL